MFIFCSLTGMKDTQGLLNFHLSQKRNLRRFFLNLVQCVQCLVPDKTVIYVENLSTFVFGCAACYTQWVETISQATFCCLPFLKIKACLKMWKCYIFKILEDHLFKMCMKTQIQHQKEYHPIVL